MDPMSTLSQAKWFGGVGSILMVLSISPMAGPIIGIVGFILVLVAVKNVSDILADASIFRNMLTATILGILGTLAVFVVFVILFPIFTAFQFSGGFPQPGVPPFSASRLFELIVSAMAGLAAVWLLFIASAVFLRRSFNSMARGLKIDMFSTVALLYLIGSVLAIVLVGFVILLIGWVLQAVAFFSIPEQLPGEAAAQTPQA
jgi:uncharacterized membrane protein